MSNSTQPNPIQLKRPDPDACSPQQSPAWRWCTAMYVSDPNCGNPPNSDDPWVQDAAEFLRQCRTGWSEGAIEPTETQRVIAEAYALLADNKVQLAIFQARLLAGETYDDIARHSGIPASVVQAYEQLFFNVTNETCLRQICGNLFQPKRVLLGLLPDRDVGSHLQMVARTEGAEGVEATAELLARLDGKTFADGLPEEAEVGRRWERMSRLGLISGLGLFKPKQLKQIKSLTGTTPSMMIAMQTAPEADLLLWDELLSQVRVPKEIRDYATGLKKATTTKKTGSRKKTATTTKAATRKKSATAKQSVATKIAA